MRIGIVGAGAVGGFLAGHLARAGTEVALLARGAHLAALRDRGLTVESQGQRWTVTVPASDRAADLGPVDAVVRHARHPYTQGLMGSIPKLDSEADRLVQIDGAMPRLTAIPPGCAFHPRCPHAFARCHVERPEPMPTARTSMACWLALEGAEA